MPEPLANADHHPARRGPSIRLLLLLTAVFAACVLAGTSYIAPALWRQHEAADWIWPTAAARADVATHPYLFQGTFRHRGDEIGFEPGGISPWLGGPRRVVLVIRIEGVLPAPGHVAAVSQALAQQWARDDGVVDGLQLDFDAPAATLRTYGDFLADVHQRLPKSWAFSITGLGSWLFDAPLSLRRDVAAQVDFIAFQFYRGRRPIRQPERYLARLRRSGVNYKIGLLPSQRDASWLPWLNLDAGFRGYLYFYG